MKSRFSSPEERDAYISTKIAHNLTFSEALDLAAALTHWLAVAGKNDGTLSCGLSSAAGILQGHARRNNIYNDRQAVTGLLTDLGIKEDIDE